MVSAENQGKQPLGHEMIRASAGAGKTYALTTRFITLLAWGVPLQSIIALTFSRKSGAEFFSKILSRLADAALQDSAASDLANAVQRPEMNAGDFALLLQELVRNWHRLSLGTMDSFFVRMTRAFPFEFGLQGEFTILDEHGLSTERHRVCRRIFSNTSTTGSPSPEQKQFIRAFEQSTWGKEESRILRLLDGYVEDRTDLYLQAPEESKWGQARTIWRQLPEFFDCTARLSDLRDSLGREIDVMQKAKSWTPAQINRLEVFQEALGSYQPGIPVPKAMEYLLEKLFESYHSLTDPNHTITITKKVKLPAPLAKVLKEIVKAMLRDEFAVCLQRTAGIWKVLDQYDSVYHEWVRRSGKLTFHDIQLLVNHEFPQEHQGDAEARRLDREEIFYRLDSRYHHWLLDEFQDTSGLQWRILNNLIGEVILDDTHERTFFAVGDIKQCIYRWRGAEPELFFRIEEQFNSAEQERIGIRTLATSYRSSPSILALPNALFGDTAALEALLPPGSLQMWRYEEHLAAPGKENLSGYSCVLEVPKPTEEAKASGQKSTDSGLLDVLKNIDPISRGLTCAVLVMRNEEVVRVAELIRAETGWSVVSESKNIYCTDNPVTLAMLDLLRCAAHPRDTMAKEHVRMTPLWKAVTDGYKTKNPGWAVLQDLADNGFEKTVQRWRGWLESQLRRELSRLDDFSAERIRELASLARKFDQTGRRDVSAFLDLAENASSAQPGTPNSILVMTWLKSKGLEYDVVLVADLDNQSHSDTFPKEGVKRNADGSLAWVTEVPNKDLALLDPTMAKMGEEFAARQWCENICKLYVAVTRAKRACFVLVPGTKMEEDRNQRLDRLVRTRLHQLNAISSPCGGTESVTIFASGDPDWHLAYPQRQTQEPVPLEFLDFTDSTPSWLSACRAAVPIRPSATSESDALLPVHALFAQECDSDKELGTALHHLLAQFTWHEECSFQSLKPRPEWSPALADRALEAASAILNNPQSLDFFSKSAHPHAELWREQPFRVQDADGEIRGVFDRVHLNRDPLTRQITGATVVEFKLNADLEQHRPQINSYRKALCHLLNLPPDRVSGALLGCNAVYQQS